MQQTPIEITDVEKALLAKLGINASSIEKLKKRAERSVSKEAKKAGVTITSEYHLVTATKCKLCGNVEVLAFHMTKQTSPGGTPVLVSENIPLDAVGGNGYKTAKQQFSKPTCSHCQTWLEGMEKQQLINIILHRENELEVLKCRRS